MPTMHKQLSEIRELQVEELDLVSGGDDGSGDGPYYPEGSSVELTVSYTTSNVGPTGTTVAQDDGSGDSVQYDNY
jgi:hypothetical protein